MPEFFHTTFVTIRTTTPSYGRQYLQYHAKSVENLPLEESWLAVKPDGNSPIKYATEALVTAQPEWLRFLSRNQASVTLLKSCWQPICQTDHIVPSTHNKVFSTWDWSGFDIPTKRPVRRLNCRRACLCLVNGSIRNWPWSIYSR